jgi:hypothetical protein
VVCARWGKKGRTWGSGVIESDWGLGKGNSPFGQDVGCSEARKQKDSSKMQEQSGNVYENKGPGFHGPTKSGNVIENKDTYEFKAGMLMKTKEVDGSWYVVGGEERPDLGFRCK